MNDAPKNRVVGYKGQFGKPDSLTRRGWEEAPNKRFAFLEVEPVTINEKPAPFQQAFNVEPAIMGLAHAISQADNDLKATGRFHDASLAEPGPEQSGKAIIARQRQDELSNGGFIAGHLIGLASVCRQGVQRGAGDHGAGARHQPGRQRPVLLPLPVLALMIGVHVRTLHAAARSGRLGVAYDTRTTFRRLRPRATLKHALDFRRHYYGTQRRPPARHASATDLGLRSRGL